MNAKPVMVRSANADRGKTGTITVPAAIREVLPNRALFLPELTEEGLLYRFVGMADDYVDPGVSLPSWAKNGESQ